MGLGACKHKIMVCDFVQIEFARRPVPIETLTRTQSFIARQKMECCLKNTYSYDTQTIMFYSEFQTYCTCVFQASPHFCFRKSGT